MFLFLFNMAILSKLDKFTTAYSKAWYLTSELYTKKIISSFLLRQTDDNLFPLIFLIQVSGWFFGWLDGDALSSLTLTTELVCKLFGFWCWQQMNKLIDERQPKCQSKKKKRAGGNVSFRCGFRGGWKKKLARIDDLWPTTNLLPWIGKSKSKMWD